MHARMISTVHGSVVIVSHNAQAILIFIANVIIVEFIAFVALARTLLHNRYNSL